MTENKRTVQSTWKLSEGRIVWVVAEGTVLAGREDGTSIEPAFCDVFELRDGKIRRLISYLMETKPTP
jgi:ketosteroid isomerase-like protein